MAGLCAALTAWADDGITWKRLASAGPRLDAKVRYPAFGASPVQRMAGNALEQAAKSAFDEIVKLAKEPAPPGRAYKNELDWGVELGINQRDLVSVRTIHFEYTGGAHPNTYQRTYNFATMGGKPKRLILRDVLRKDVSPLDWANVVVLRGLNKAKEARDIEPFGYLDAPLVNSFYMTGKGMVWVFEHYAVGPYSEGPYEIEVQWPALKDAIDPDGPAGRFIK